MEDDIQTYLPTVMFRGTPCIGTAHTHRETIITEFAPKSSVCCYYRTKKSATNLSVCLFS